MQHTALSSPKHTWSSSASFVFGATFEVEATGEGDDTSGCAVAEGDGTAELMAAKAPALFKFCAKLAPCNALWEHGR
jgi:hypothetical protein